MVLKQSIYQQQQAKPASMYVLVHLLYISSSIPYDAIFQKQSVVLFVCWPYLQPHNQPTKPSRPQPPKPCYIHISSNSASNRRLIIIRDCKCASLQCQTLCGLLLAMFLCDIQSQMFVPHGVLGYHTYIKYDVYELPGEDRQFYVIHFYKKRRVDGYRDDYSLGQLTKDLSGTVSVSLWFRINL